MFLLVTSVLCGSRGLAGSRAGEAVDGELLSGGCLAATSPADRSQLEPPRNCIQMTAMYFSFSFFFFPLNYLAGSLFLFLQNAANVTARCPGTPRSDTIKSLYLYTSLCFNNWIWDLGDLETSLSGSLFSQIDCQSQIKCCFISKYFFKCAMVLISHLILVPRDRKSLHLVTASC